MSLVSSLIPINLGWLELRSLLVGSYGHLTHNYLNYPYPLSPIIQELEEISTQKGPPKKNS